MTVEALDPPRTASVDPSGGGYAVGGVAVAQVINNIDVHNLGRVQLRLPWLIGVEPWARVAAPAAGSGHGCYFIPQVGEEVLVAFHHGDVRDAYVIGSLWNFTDRPPSSTALDPVQKRIIRTPAGHVLEFDDLRQSVTLTTSTGQAVELTPESVKVSTSGGSEVVLKTAGSVSISAPVQIELKAPSVTLDATTLELKAEASARLTAGGSCEIQGTLVKIN
jgi:uncharacterized protein involved in type VI secretion and phage assembly